ncbi:MAG: LTA synthase family protein [Clostridiaceae bacterium]|nr:LTA synthase family protein [Clostridiaceae bacterium]
MEKLKTLGQNYFDIITFIIILTIKFCIYSIYILEGYFSFRANLLPILASVFVLCSITLLFKPNHRAKLLYGFNIVLTLIIVSDLVYYGYFRDILCIPVLKNGIMLGPVKSSIFNLFKPKFLLFLFDLVILPFLYFKKINHKENTLRFRLVSFIILFAISGSISGYQIYKLNKEQPRLLTTMFNRIYIAKTLGNFNFHLLDVYNFTSQQIQKSKALPAGREAAIQSFLNAKDNSPKTSNLKGTGVKKNLIIIQVEALQGFALNTKINGQEITPNLNRFAKKSAYFDNYFYQVASGNTSDAEFMTNNSLYPAAQGAVAYLYYSNEFNSLPKALEKNGYSTSTLHGYKEDFWNRSVMNKTEGFDSFYGEKSFNIDESIGLGLSDKSFLTQALDKLSKLQSPYYSLLITLTSHFPFDNVEKYGSFDVGSFEGTLLGNYMKSIHYTDKQLGDFLDKLSENGTLDNSILMLYGDHYALPKEEQNNLNQLLNLTDTSALAWMQLQKIPMLIHFPQDSNSGVNHLYGGEMDLYPTVANLFNLPTKDLLGKDLFNSTIGKVIFRNGSFTNGKTFYLSQSNSFYDIETKKPINETPELKNEKETSENILQYSDDILNHNLLKTFNKTSK